MELEFGKPVGDESYNNVAFDLNEDKVTIKENKTWAFTSTNILNALPTLPSGKTYRDQAETSRDINNSDKVQEGLKTYIVYNGNDASDEKFLIFGKQAPSDQETNFSTLSGPSKLKAHPSLSNPLRNQNQYHERIVDGSKGQGDRWDNWGEYNREQNNNYLTFSNFAVTEEIYFKVNLWLVFQWSRDGEQFYSFPKELRIQTSNDGIEWKNVDNQNYVFDKDWFSSVNNRGRVEPSHIIRSTGARHGVDGNISASNNIMEVPITFNPTKAKYIRVKWEASIDEELARRTGGTGKQLLGFTNIELVKIYDESESGPYHQRYDHLLEKTANNISFSYNNQNDISLSEEITNFDNIIQKDNFDLSDLVINNENNPKLSIEKELLKTYKDGSSQNVTYAQVAIRLKNGAGEIVKTYIINFGQRPVNTSLLNDTKLKSVIDSNKANDPRGTVRRLIKDIESWKNIISSRSESTLVTMNINLDRLLVKIQQPDYQLEDFDIEQWFDFKNTIINIMRENTVSLSENDKRQRIENALENIRSKWNDLQQYIINKTEDQTLSEDKQRVLQEMMQTTIPQFFEEIHQPMMNDRSKTIQDLERHLTIVTNKFNEIKSQLEN